MVQNLLHANIVTIDTQILTEISDRLGTQTYSISKSLTAGSKRQSDIDLSLSSPNSQLFSSIIEKYSYTWSQHTLPHLRVMGLPWIFFSSLRCFLHFFLFFQKLGQLRNYSDNTSIVLWLNHLPYSSFTCAGRLTLFVEYVHGPGCQK